MYTKQANYFLFPMGWGSVFLLCLSSSKNGTYSLFTDNATYEWPIAGLLLISFIYFLTDFLMMIIRNKPRKIYMIHHLVGMFSIIITYVHYYVLIKYLLAYLMYELSTPLMNICLDNRRALSPVRSAYATIIEFSFFIIYSLVRIIFGTYLTLYVVPIVYNLDNCMAKFIVIFPIILQILNYWWYIKLIRMLRKKFKTG